MLLSGCSTAVVSDGVYIATGETTITGGTITYKGDFDDLIEIVSYTTEETAEYVQFHYNEHIIKMYDDYREEY